jgi:hypothetical protein
MCRRIVVFFDCEKTLNAICIHHHRLGTRRRFCDVDTCRDSATGKSSVDRTQTPETKGQKQPQGWTGPIDTGTGGAPASSPQGQSPPGMQAAPEGSLKTTVAPDKDN